MKNYLRQSAVVAMFCMLVGLAGCASTGGEMAAEAAAPATAGYSAAEQGKASGRLLVWTANFSLEVADLNKAVKLFPDFAYAYYNRANLLALSGSLPEAFEDYTKAISLNPAFAVCVQR